MARGGQGSVQVHIGRDRVTDTQVQASTVDQESSPSPLATMMDPAHARDPRPFFAGLRQAGVIREGAAVPGRQPTVLVSRYEDVQSTLRNARVFSSRFGDGISGLGNDRPLIPLQIDPPEHK